MKTTAVAHMNKEDALPRLMHNPETGNVYLIIGEGAGDTLRGVIVHSCKAFDKVGDIECERDYNLLPFNGIVTLES